MAANRSNHIVSATSFRAFFPLLFPVVFLLLSMFVLDKGGNAVINGLPIKPPETLLVYSEAASRLYFLVCFIVLIAVSALPTLLLANELLRGSTIFPENGEAFSFNADYPEGTGPTIIVLWILGCLVMALLTFLSDQSRQLTIDFLGSDLFKRAFSVCLGESALQAGEMNPCLFGGELNDDAIPKRFGLYVDLAQLAIICGTLSAALCCCLPLTLSDEKIRERQRDIFRMPRTSMYLSSLLFSVSMLTVFSVTNFPISFIADVDGQATNRAAYIELRNALSIYLGVGFSVLVLSYYLPCVIVLDSRLKGVGGSVDGGDQNNEEVRKQMEPRYIRQIENAIAFVAPLLTALASSIGAQYFSL